MAKKQKDINIAGRVHDSLREHSAWYADWHNHPGHKGAQWAILVLVAIAVGGLFYLRSITPDDNRALDAARTKAAAEESYWSAEEAKIQDQTKSLFDLAQSYKKADETEKSAILAQMVEIARQRSYAVETAADQKPGAVLNVAIPAQVKAQLPREVARYIEEEVTEEGTFEWKIAMDFDAGTKQNFFALVNSRGVKQAEVVFPDEVSPAAMTGDRVRIKGVKVDDKLIVANQSRSFSVLAASTAPVNRKVAVILFNFRNNTAQPFSPEYARSTVFTGTPSVNNYYQETSYGLLSLSGRTRPDGDVYGWYTINHDWNVDCPNNVTGSWTQAAEQAAAADGFNAANYDNIIYAFNQGQCGWAGIANVGGAPGRSWINNNTFHMGVVAHEFGHNIGRMHASTAHCIDASGARASVSNNCTFGEYGDPFNVMGPNALRHMHGQHKGINYVPNLGWLGTSNTRTLDRSANPDGTYTIVPLEPNLSGVQTLRIPINYPFGGGAMPAYYYLDFRQPMGYDNFASSDPVVNGVSIRVGGSYDYRFSTPTSSGVALMNSYLLDSTLETTSYYDSALPVGRTFNDPASNTTVTVESVSAAGAVVRVQLGTLPCQNQNPAVTLSPSQTTIAAGGTIPYTITLRNTDAADCGGSTYSIVPQLPAGWTQTPSSFTETLPPGASITRTFLITTSSSTPASSLQVNQLVTRVGGGAVNAYATAYITVLGADITPPSVTISSPVNNAIVKAKGKMNVTSSAYDNIRVTSIKVYTNTTLVKTCLNVNSCNISVNLNSMPPGANQIKVEATDSSGNIGSKIHLITKP